MEERNLLIAVSSCWRYEQNGWNNALRDTWLQDANRLGIPYRFFHGRGEGTKRDDIVELDCYDDYASLMYKTLAKFRWCLEAGYTSLFHCYHDTYACVERLNIPQGVDYFGDYLHEDPRQPWPHESYNQHCQSGAGVFLSLPAIRAAIDGIQNTTIVAPRAWEEDLVTGQAVRDKGLIIKDTRDMPCNLTQHDHGPRRGNNIISCHLSTIQPDGRWHGQGRETEWKYRPEFMHKLHREWQESCK